MKRSVVLAVILFLSAGLLYGQEPTAEKISQLNQTGMLVLGGWAVANIGTGIYGYYNTEGSRRFFYQMNAFWNVVNLGIATAGYFGNDLTGMDPHQVYEKTAQMQKILLINGGLDLLYIGGGLLMRHANTSRENLKTRLRGYGNSVMLQGAFLLVFDVVLFALNRQYEQLYLHPVLDLQSGAAGMAFSISF